MMSPKRDHYFVTKISFSSSNKNIRSVFFTGPPICSVTKTKKNKYVSKLTTGNYHYQIMYTPFYLFFSQGVPPL